VSESLSPERTTPLLRGRFGRPYLYRESCGTTQELLGPDLPEGAVAVAEEQRAGRGRHGRSWVAPHGTAILCSVLLRPPPERLISELSLVAGVAAAQAVEGTIAKPVQIKWPNDLLLDGAKVGGILAEARDGAVVVGTGLNVNQTRAQLPTDTALPAGSLREAVGKDLDRAKLLVRLLEELEHAYDGWLDVGLAGVSAELHARDYLRGRQVSVGDVAGVARGFGDRGLLVVETPEGRVEIASGEVRLAF
jgi:BirA family biotin operon repressor/biotin-[acetyl-CoA-carboxylase] ligase